MHVLDTSVGMLHERSKVGNTERAERGLWGLVLAVQQGVWCVCEEIDTRAGVHICVRTSSLSAYAPSFTLLLSHKASVSFSSAGVLSGDSSSGTHVPSFWHWPRVIEMQTENTLNQMGSKSSKYLARTFLHWWSRPVYGRWNKVRADGLSAYRAFIWTVLKSNKANTTTCRNRRGFTGADPPISSH